MSYLNLNLASAYEVELYRLDGYKRGYRYYVTVGNHASHATYERRAYTDRAEAVAFAKEEARKRMDETDCAAVVSDTAMAGGPVYIGYPGSNTEYDGIGAAADWRPMETPERVRAINAR